LVAHERVTASHDFWLPSPIPHCKWMEIGATKRKRENWTKKVSEVESRAKISVGGWR
jgi:hypothetical protein